MAFSWIPLHRRLGLRTRFSLVGLTGLVIFVAVSCGDEDESPSASSSTSSSSSSGGVEAGNDSQTASSSGTLPDGPTDTGTGLSPTYVHRDINHVLGTGQSLSVGAVGNPVLSSVQPYANQMFSTGIQAGAVNLTELVPLVEGPQVETMSAAFANLTTKVAQERWLVGQPTGRTSHDLLVSLHGVGGIAYSGLKKGTAPYAAGIAQAQAGFDIAKKLNKSYVVRAITNVHGESDHVAQNANYAADLAEWQSNYETDIKAINGQLDPIPMLHTQMSSWTKYGQATSLIPFQQLATHMTSNGKIVLVGPKYNLEYAADGVHLTNHGYQHMGEYYAKAYQRIILEGKPWEPLRPSTVTRAGAVITIKFVVPTPPLVLDTDLVSDPGNFGFEYGDMGIVAPPSIKSVALAGPDTVVITLTKEPTGTDKRIRYAFGAAAGSLAGPKTGPRGNLRDSDKPPSRTGFPLYNWCVHFDEAVP